MLTKPFIANRCYDAEEEVPGEHTHTINDKEKHSLSKVIIRILVLIFSSLGIEK